MSLETAFPVETAPSESSTRMTPRSRAWLLLGSGILARTLAWGVIEAGIIAATLYQSLSLSQIPTTSLSFSSDVTDIYLRTFDLLLLWLILSLAAFMGFFCEEVRSGLVSFILAQFIAFPLAAGILSRSLPQGVGWEWPIGAIAPYYFQTLLDAIWFLVGILIIVLAWGFGAVLVGLGVREWSWPQSPLSPSWKILPLGLTLDCLAVFWPISPSTSGNVITNAGTVPALDNWSIPIMAALVGLAILVHVLWFKKVPREIRVENSAIPRMVSVMVGGFAVISLLFAGSVYNYSIDRIGGDNCIVVPRVRYSGLVCHLFSPGYQAAAYTFLAILLVLGFSLIPPALTLYGTRRLKNRPRPRMEQNLTGATDCILPFFVSERRVDLTFSDRSHNPKDGIHY